METPVSADPNAELPEILVDHDERWWVSRLNRLNQVQQGTLFPSRVRIRDCTLREGEETPGTHLKRDQKLKLARLIEETGFDELELGYLGAVDEHRDLAAYFRRAGLTIKFTSINRSYGREGEWQTEIDRAVEAGANCISFVVFCNTDLLTSVPWLRREAVPERVHSCVNYARNCNVEVAITVAGAARTAPRWIEATAQAGALAGADVVGIADSMGCGLPETISYLMRLLRDAVGPKPTLAFHGHDTFGLATANALAAIKAGAGIIDAVPLGLGEGAGITPLEEVVFALEVLYGVDTGLELGKVAALGREVKEVFGVSYLPTKSILGDGLYRHSIDSHIASILRGAWYSWECINPAVVGQERKLEFGFAKVRRGRSGAVAAKIEQMGLQANDDQLNEIIDRIQLVTKEHGWATEATVEDVIRTVLDGSTSPAKPTSPD
jgi:isopropylmalate/homocitrate/citramalate synthase